MELQNFDVVVIGGGPGGYICAIRASQLGFTVACIDKRPTLGGTCLNVGCIPSKALLNSSYKFVEAQKGFADHGLVIGSLKLDLAAMLARKTKVVDDLTKGIAYLFKKNKVAFFEGRAVCMGQGRVHVTAEGGDVDLQAKHIVVATGSAPVSLPGVEIDEERVVSSTGALSLKTVPQRLAVIGGGYIGLEMASVWSRLGAQATVIEFLDKIVPAMDQSVGQALQKLLTKQGFEFKLGTKVAGVKKMASGIELALESVSCGQKSTLVCDVVLMAIGRKPFTEGLGLEALGAELDAQGRIVVNDRYETNIPGVYAIGDVIQGPMLAHKAGEEGCVLAELLAGQTGSEVNYGAIPSVIYTHPEAASVGETEEALNAKGFAYKTGVFPLAANSRAKTNGKAEGFVKILADAKTDRVLGVHILAPEAGTMIAEAVLAMEFGASSEDIARTCHAHPTLNEALKEAALAVAGRAIHV